MKPISTPLTDDVIAGLKAGDNVLITGTIFTGRDAAHKKLFDLIQNGEKLPFALQGQIIFYVGPTPARPGKPIGSAGPTTSYRMDAYAPKLYELGLKASIGKGSRNAEVKESLKKFKAVYLAVTGGATLATHTRHGSTWAEAGAARSTPASTSTLRIRPVPRDRRMCTLSQYTR